MLTRKRSNGTRRTSYSNNNDKDPPEMESDPNEHNGNLNGTAVARQRPSVRQWTAILPEKMSMSGDLGGLNLDGCICKLPHPKSGIACLFMICGREVYEVLKFKEEFHSWFVDDSVLKDGSLILTSPVDPLFLVIPFLEKASETNKFMTIDQILLDKKFTHIGKVENCVRNEDLCNVCDFKGSDDLLVYRFSEDRFLAWLALKTERLATHLRKANVHVTSGSQVATLVRSSKDSDVRESDYVKYALGLISDYAAPHWTEKLKERLQIEDSVELTSYKNNSEEPPSKKQKTESSESSGMVEDYRKFNSEKDSKAKANTALTTTQKKLAKIDKTGMKSLTSFFTAKAKK